MLSPQIRDAIKREQRRRLTLLNADRAFLEASRTSDPRAKDSQQVRAMLLAMRHLEIGPAYLANSEFASLL